MIQKRNMTKQYFYTVLAILLTAVLYGIFVPAKVSAANYSWIVYDGPSSKTTTSTSTSEKKIKMDSAAKTTHSKSMPSETVTSTSTKKVTLASYKYNKVTTKKTVTTYVTKYYTAGSYYKTVKTKVVTKTTVTTTKYRKSKPTAAYTVGIDTIAPEVSSNVRSAFKKLGFTVKILPNVNYAGKFVAKDKAIYLSREDEVIFHELGHFIAFVAGNADKTTSFKEIYEAEKSKYTRANIAYATQNSSEYFAESYYEYILYRSTLKANRPRTYNALISAVNKITDDQVAKILSIYGPIWS